MRACRNRSRSWVLPRAARRLVLVPQVCWRPIWPQVNEAATSFASLYPEAALWALQRNTNWRLRPKHTGEPDAARSFATRTAVYMAPIVREQWGAKSIRTLSDV